MFVTNLKFHTKFLSLFFFVFHLPKEIMFLFIFQYLTDIAVGAPYEEDSGVVYIYNGAKHGLRQEPSQRIVGKSLSKGLKGFGWSFSQPWDVDGNHYGGIYCFD